MPAVSVMMPVYNGADYLDRALESLSKQTFRDLRVIISDNASTDATPEIIEKWKTRDPRFTSFRQSTNIGAAANFDWVLDHADTQWVMFASHDDWWSENYVEVLYQTATRYPDAKLAVGMTTFIRPDGSHDPKPYYDRLNGLTGMKRLRKSLTHVPYEAIYGLFDREALKAALSASKRHPMVWAGNGLVLLPFLLSQSVFGHNAAVYYKLITPLSEPRYRPKTLAAEYGVFLSFLRVSLLTLLEARMPPMRKLWLLPMMIVYTNNCGWRLSRLLRDSLLYPFKRAKRPRAA